MVNRDGEDIDILMVIYMKGSGKMILNKGRVQCGILITINIKAIGIKEKKMHLENTIIIMEQSMKEILIMVEKMVLGLLYLLMGHGYKLTGTRRMSKVQGGFFIRMETILKVNIITHKSMVRVYMYGEVIRQSIKVNLKRIHYKDRRRYILLINSIFLVG